MQNPPMIVNDDALAMAIITTADIIEDITAAPRTLVSLYEEIDTILPLLVPVKRGELQRHRGRRVPRDLRPAVCLVCKVFEEMLTARALQSAHYRMLRSALPPIKTFANELRRAGVALEPTMVCCAVDGDDAAELQSAFRS